MTEEVHTVKQAASLPTVTNLADADRVLVLTGGTTFARAPETALQVERWAEADARYNALSGTVASLTGASNIVGAFSAASRAALVLDVAAGRLDDVVDGALVWASPLGSADPIAFKKQSGATMFADLPGLVYAGQPRPEHHTENVTPGTTDMTAALQWCLDQDTVSRLAPVTYRVTSSLIVDPGRNRECGFYCPDLPSRYPFTVQPGGPTKWADCRILWDGATGASEAIIRASAEAVGVEPGNTFGDTIWGLRLHGLILDGADKAGFGLYAARVQQLDLVSLNVTRTTVAGWSLNGTYSGRTMNCKLFRNKGRGGEEGYADIRWGWTNQDKVNALIHYNLHGEANGGAEEYREADDNLRTFGCGYYWGPHRAGAIFGITCENNYGANLVFAPSGGGNRISGYYSEKGNTLPGDTTSQNAVQNGHGTKHIGLMFVGVASALNCVVDGGGILVEDAVVITGTEPTGSRRESGFELRNMVGNAADGIHADWGNYRVVNCSSEFAITGTQPAGASTLQGGLQFAPGADVLDVYDVGTFTPTLAGSTVAGVHTYGARTGNYTRIGNRVFFDIDIALTATDGLATGVIRVTGLPFSAAGTTAERHSVAISDWLGLTSEVAGGQIFGGTNYITVNRSAGGAANTVNATEITATTRLYIAGSYRVA